MSAVTPAESIELDVFACPLDGLRLIEASAGTGKTWNICGLYLRLLLELNLEVQQILVVTFTNAATAELRERLRSRIVEVLTHLRHRKVVSDPFVTRLVATMEANAGVDRRCIVARLDAALHAFDEAAVFTIHGFCQRALSDTPFAAGLPFSLELLHDDQSLRLEAVSDFWRRRVAGGEISPALADYLLQQGDSPEHWAEILGRQLAKPCSRLRWPEEMASAAVESAVADRAAAFARARQLWGSDGAAPTATLLAGIGALNAITYHADAVHLAAAAWTRWLASGNPFPAPDAAASKAQLFSCEFMEHRKKKGQTPPSHPFFDAARDLLASHAAAERRLRTERLFLLRRMFDEAAAALRQQKRQQRVISFDDMLHNLAAALAASDLPWLAAALRSRFPVALIDEFQDTDPLQWAIFERIYGAAGSSAGGPLFLVGDPKQAIYSFRNADLHTYLTARRQADAPYTLRHNQRSTAALIEACNALFTINANAFLLPGLRYQTVTRGDRPRPPFADHSDGDPSALRIWRLPKRDGEYLLRAQAIGEALRATAGEVARLLRDAQAGRVTIGERPLAPGDIAILVKSHAHGRLTREALQQVGVGCVELSQQSIFHSSDAEELERVLVAVIEPGRPELLYAALASELLGHDATAIAALAADEVALLQVLSRFHAYHETWLRRGFGVMFRNWLDGESVARRLLARGDGERRMTNLLHLGELLQQAAVEHPAPDALLHWFTGRRREGGTDEVAQLRLESDRKLVQIVTIHRAKGLEYGVVFCPLLWDGRPSPERKLEGSEYHDDDGRPVIDFRPEVEAGEAAEIKARQQQEKDAEQMRLLYVALTRAVYRCYLVAGCYATANFGRRSLTQGTRSLLNWLVAGRNLGYSEWRVHDLPPATIENAWQALADAAAPQLSLADLPSAAATPLARDALAADSLAALAPPGRLPPGWQLASFSSLQHGAGHEAAACDHDGRGERSPMSAARSEDSAGELAADDILHFPRGAAAGDCLHALFEAIDFTDPDGWPDAIARVLAAHPQALPGLPATEADRRLARMLRRLLDDVLATTLPGGIVLGALGRRGRLVELGFHLSTGEITPKVLNGWLQKHGYAMPRLGFPPLAGYLKGFIDLVFCHADRYYVLDWKSNHLGYTSADYDCAPIAAAMAEHGYHLQYLIYTVALHRYLRRRIPDYDYERDFGGVLYLFVRGVRPAWRMVAADGESIACGIYHHRPSAGTIASLDALLAGTRAAVA
ncbi:MAG TPA: exodeoxyribonuclease V subunit beta [Accumulibacter sp.]|uniref:exodeoxyribonuclease V subunit beta n=1 Tax=Accumulibacter sp. TaxID=2053492 RepID=UPI0025F12E03|nr:exodeoxyribonuclease V subunit beta [Accumulibacter sp.]MCM8598778.1 exodeoxyribonuclease V subunit beta [Accumulibacter sp.]HNC51845.1 exodeoxyribonuclease V subunit beta [Accumulibacter sp.]